MRQGLRTIFPTNPYSPFPLLGTTKGHPYGKLHNLAERRASALGPTLAVLSSIVVTTSAQNWTPTACFKPANDPLASPGVLQAAKNAKDAMYRIFERSGNEQTRDDSHYYATRHTGTNSNDVLKSLGDVICALGNTNEVGAAETISNAILPGIFRQGNDLPHAHALTGYGRIFLNKRDPKRAAACLKEAAFRYRQLDRREYEPCALLHLIDALLAQGLVKEAVEVENEMGDMAQYALPWIGATKADYYARIMRIRYHQKLYQEALDFSHLSREEDGDYGMRDIPTYLKYEFFNGLCYYRLANYSEAKKLLLRTISSVHHPDAYLEGRKALLDILSRATKDWHLCLPMAEKLYRNAEKFPAELQGEICSSVGEVLVKMGEFKKAEDALKKGLTLEAGEITESSASAHQSLALVSAKKGEFVQAVEYQRTFIYLAEKLGKTNTKDMGGYLHDLGVLEVRANFLDVAELTFYSALQTKLRFNAPGSKTLIRTRKSLAELLIRMGKASHARKVIEEGIEQGGEKVQEELAPLLASLSTK